MKIIYFLLFLQISLGLTAQVKGDYIWLLGQDFSSSPLGLGYRFDFNNIPFKPADLNGAVSVFAASLAILNNNDAENCPNPIQVAGCPNNIDEVETNSDIIISPNPFDTKVFIEFSNSVNKNLEVKVFSITGVLLI